MQARGDETWLRHWGEFHLYGPEIRCVLLTRGHEYLAKWYHLYVIRADLQRTRIDVLFPRSWVAYRALLSASFLYYLLDVSVSINQAQTTFTKASWSHSCLPQTRSGRGAYAITPSVQPNSKCSSAAASVWLPTILQLLTGRTSTVGGQPHSSRGKKEVSFVSRETCQEGWHLEHHTQWFSYSLVLSIGFLLWSI